MANANEIDYPPEATLGDQRLRRTAGKFRFEPPGALPSSVELRQEIARLAYELYLRHGRRPGGDVEDWLAAEALVCSRIAQREKAVGDHIDGKEAE